MAVSTPFDGKGGVLVPSSLQGKDLVALVATVIAVIRHINIPPLRFRFKQIRLPVFGFGFRMSSHGELLFYLYLAINQHSPNSSLFITIIGIYCHFQQCLEVVRITARLWRKVSRALQVF